MTATTETTKTKTMDKDNDDDDDNEDNKDNEMMRTTRIRDEDTTIKKRTRTMRDDYDEG